MKTLMSKNGVFCILVCVLTILSVVSGELTCPGGWRLYYKDQKCVRIFFNAWRWADARTVCQRQGGDLMTVKDTATNKFLDDLHKRHRVIAWIGAHKVKNVFKWLDDTSKIGFRNWDRSVAKKKGRNLDCVSLIGTSVKWNKLKCTDKASAVCSQDAFHNARSMCQGGWYPYNRNCYRLYKINKSWTDARKYCRRQKGRLVSVLDKPTDDFIARTFLVKDRGNIWHGLYDQTKKGGWAWIDTRYKLGKYKPWGGSQPNNYNGLQFCVHYWSNNNNKWADSECRLKYHFICQKRSYNVDINCQAGWDLNLQYKTCIRRYQYKRKWTVARAICQKIGGDLVQIPDSKFNKYIIGRLGTSASSYWTGLHELPSTQTMRWLDFTNKAPKFTNFGSTPGVSGKQNCVVVSRTNIRWQKLDCNSKNYFMCQKAPYASIECPTGYTVYKRTRTCVRFSKDTLEWEKARKVCQGEGGDLITIDSSVLNSYIISLVKKDKDKYFIGLHDRQKENDFHWLDTTSKLKFKYWSKGEPNNKNQNQNCVNLNGLKEYRWWDGNCHIRRRYICQHVAKVNGWERKVPSVPLNCPTGWSMYKPGKTCIKYFSDTKSWADARNYCRMQTGDLVKITDKPFNVFVNNMLGKVGAKQEAFIGFNDIKVQGKYRWLDETIDRKYDNWHNGEPSNGKEDCALIVVDPTYHYEWNDVSCASKKASICQMSALNPGSPNCGEGWEDTPDSDYCYRINTEPLTWDDAKGSCKIYGGNLVSIVSPEEMIYISGRIQGLTVDTLWTGGNDKAFERGWRWVDKQPFPYFNWALTPPKRNESLNCISINKDTGRWTVESCLNHHPSICKKLGKVINHPTPTPTPAVTNLPKNKVWGCRKGWISYRGSCYASFTSTSGKTWTGANNYCKSAYTNLVAITDYFENRFVLSLLRGKTAWIGFNALNRKFSFTWSDGITPVTYTNWNHGQPNYYTTDEYCSRMSTKGTWDDRSCKNALEKYWVCKENKQIRDKSAFQKYNGCDKVQGGYGFQATCYVFYSALYTFDQGEKVCKSKGGHLATVSDRYVQAFLTSELTLYKMGFWIGLSNTKKSTSGDTASQYVYSWTSGRSLYFTNWDRAHSGNESNTCVGMEAKQPTGLWHNYPCSTKKNFICESPRVGFTTPKPVPTTPNLAPCPPNWIAIDHLCYKAFVGYTSNHKKNWMDAKSSCESLASGGTLACITSDALKNRLKKEMNDGKVRFINYKTVWIGLNDRDMEGGYKWLDGQPFVYTLWSFGQPDNKKNRENCVSWSLSTSGKWRDESCYTLHNFICQAPRGAQVYTTLKTPSVGPTVTQCGIGIWTMYNGYCYSVDRSFSKKTWFQAKDSCASKGAHLVSITDPKENNYIAALINNLRVTSVWIGLNNFDGDVYKWTDGTPAYYFDWLLREPNDFGTGERCVEMQNNAGWNDEICQKKHNFVCKKRPGSFSPLTTVPPTPPTGGCPAKFFGVPGTSQCYYVGGVKEKDRQTFKGAVAACKNVLAKSRLASIHSDIDEDFVMTLIAELQTPAWIGLQKPQIYNPYQWIDNTQKDYHHWGRWQPKTFRFRGKTCAGMMIVPRDAGYWETVTCTDKFAYVCEYRKDPLFKPNSPKTGDCLNGYQKFRESCYQYISTPQTWSQSEATCNKDGGHLIGISDGFEKAFVNILMSTQAIPQIWIGLSDNSQMNSFTWSNGWPVIQTFWYSKQPDLTYKCVVNNRGQGWSTKDCQINLPFVCEIHDVPPPIPTAVPGKCPSNIWTQYGEYCYYVEAKQLKSWPEASYVCKNLGGDLASIHSPTDAHIVFNYLVVDQLDAWIGLQRSGPGTFTWSDGSAAQFFKWASGSPMPTNDTKYQGCVLAQGINGNWTDISCFRIHGYICKVKQIPLFLPTMSTTTTTITTASKSTSTVAPKVVTSKVVTTKRAVPKSTTSQPSGQGFATQKSSPQNSQSQSSGMKAGGISGIVIGVIAVIAIVIVGVFFMRKRMAAATPSPTASGFDNAVYEASRDENPSIQFSGISDS